MLHLISPYFLSYSILDQFIMFKVPIFAVRELCTFLVEMGIRNDFHSIMAAMSNIAVSMLWAKRFDEVVEHVVFEETLIA